MAYWLVGNIDGKRFQADLAPGANVVGRSSRDSTVTIPRDTVSRRHARIVVEGHDIELEDLNSHNHTYVNGKLVDRATLRPGDSIRFGDADLVLVAQEDLAHGEEAPPKLMHTPSTEQRDAVPTFRSDAQLQSMHLTWSQSPVSSGKPTLDNKLRGPSHGELLEALVDLGSFLVRDEPGRNITAACLEHVARLFPFRLACFLELNQSSGEAEIQAHHPANLEPELEVSRTMVDKVLRERKTLLVQDVALDVNLYETAHKKGIRSAIVTPVIHEEEVIGVLYVDRQDHLQPYQKRDQEQLQFLANILGAKIASTRTRNEIEWAGFIQGRLLPQTFLQPPGYEAAAHLVPSEQIGGDLYDSLELPNGCILYALGDLVGHGVGAALMMSNALATMRVLSRLAESPLGLAEDLHELMREQLAPHGYMTLFLGFLDPRTHALEYVTAGHPPPLLLGPGAPAEFLASTGGPIGMSIPVPLRSARTTLSPGSLLAIWSDGIPEALRLGARPMQDFTQARLVARLQEWSQEPLQVILERVFRESDEFVGNARAQDDRTMVLLRRKI